MADTEYTREDDIATIRHTLMTGLGHNPAIAALNRLAALPSASLGEQREPDATVRAIEEHIHGWRSATFGWQGDPNPKVEWENRQRAVQEHAAECLRRIHAVLATSPASKSAGGVVMQQARDALQKTMAAWGGTCAWHADVKAAIAAIDAHASDQLGTSPDQQKGGDGGVKEGSCTYPDCACVPNGDVGCNSPSAAARGLSGGPQE